MKDEIYIPEGIHPVFREKICHVAKTLVRYADSLYMEQLWLFGSVARGEYTAVSDIDILVLTSAERERVVSARVEELELRDDVGYPNVDIIVRNRKSLENDANALFNNAVLHDRIILWEV